MMMMTMTTMMRVNMLKAGSTVGEDEGEEDFGLAPVEEASSGMKRPKGLGLQLNLGGESHVRVEPAPGASFEVGAAAEVLLHRGDLEKYLAANPQSARRIQDEMMTCSLLTSGDATGEA